MTDLTVQRGVTRTDMHCTECSKGFIAAIDFDVDGNHVIECPWCRHEHCRIVKDGKVTGDRWSSRVQRVDVPPARVWKAHNQPIMTTTASAFIRDKWLNRQEH